MSASPCAEAAPLPVRAGRRGRTADHRMVLPALACWAACLVAVQGVPRPVVVVVLGVLLAVLGVSLRRGRHLASVVLLLAAAALLTGAVRSDVVASGPVADAGRERAMVTTQARVVTDPRVVGTSRGDVVVVRVSVRRLERQGRTVRVRTPVLVWADPSWREVRVGSRVALRGRAGPADDTSVAATVDASGPPRELAPPGWWWGGVEHLRRGVTASVADRSDDVAGLVPALVHGDDSGLPDDLDDAFRASGLTHLLAVSGTNLTLVVGALLALVRLLRGPPRVQLVVGLLGTAGFVLLARPEPSVVRAAAMGVVALAGLGAGGRRRGMRALGWAVTGLLLLDPWLSRTPGFVLSVTATAGILVLAPAWRDALARWMPRWVAEAVAVPLAAQVACTPAVAAVSGQVSLVAVAANVLAAPAVGPATVLGLVGGAVAVPLEPAGRLVGLVTALPAGWICLVGRRGAAFAGASLTWGSGPAEIVLLVGLCVLVALATRPVLRRPALTVGVSLALGIAIWRPVSPGWPPSGWVMVACDVGQGDATVLDAGGGTAVVVDTGPDPAAVDRCLDRLGVRRVAAVLLTHGHADHVDGLEGTARGRPVGAVGLGPSGGPALPGVPTRTVGVGSRGGVGDVTWEVLGPSSSRPLSAEGEDAAANDASLVLLATVRGVRILLTGDVEPSGQARLLRQQPTAALRADVLKMPHHGSARQDPRFLAASGAALVTVSAGRDNDYGHPSPRALRLVERLGMRVLRTDTDGDVAVVLRDGAVRGVVG